MEYLGAVLSYGSMELQTVQARASKAWTNYNKLRPILRLSSSFSLISESFRRVWYRLGFMVLSGWESLRLACV